jgi:hypothetical protein
VRSVPAGVEEHDTCTEDIVAERAWAPARFTVNRPEAAGVSVRINDSGATGGRTIVVVVVVVVVVPNVVLGPVVVEPVVVVGAAVIEGLVVVGPVFTVVVSRSTCNGD